MPRTDVTVPTPNGSCPATFCTPAGTGPWPAVILYPDAGGRRSTMEDMGERLAELGYAVLVPDVYYRSGDWAPFDMDTAFSDESERTRLFSLMRSLGPDEVSSDAAAFMDFLNGQQEVAGAHVGTTGYCMGGRHSLMVAGQHPERVAAAASFHGGGLSADDPDAPIALADRVRATVYVAGATDDASFTSDDAERLDAAYSTAGVEHTVEFYPAGHGFAVPDNGTYDEDADARHWQALERLYGAALSA